MDSSNEYNDEKNIFISSNQTGGLNNESGNNLNNKNNEMKITNSETFVYLVNPIEKHNEDKETQTEFSQLYIKENEEEGEEEEEKKLLKKKKKKKRKNDTDLIRNKIFNHFNKVIYNWLIISKNDQDKIEIIQYRPEKLNKELISTLMGQKIKELFVQKNSSNIIINNLLKKKLEYTYQELYNYFISDKENINEEKEFLNDFFYLKNYIESLKGKEDENYINRLKTIALEFDKWKDKKVHLFKKKNKI